MRTIKKKDKGKIPVGLRVANDVHKKLKLIAEAQKRSISNQAEVFILEALDNYELPTDTELLELASKNWPDTDEDIYDIVKKDKRQSL